jgi:uncharacterized membrane protein YhhN
MKSQGARWALAAAVLTGVSYVATWSLPLAPALAVAWKGAGVGLLALFAALSARRLDGWLLAAVMALGAAGDMLLETSGLIVGALAFLAGHLLAVALYLRNRRRGLSVTERTVGLALAAAIALVAFALPLDRAAAPGVGLYALGLGAMTASAFISRFPRPLTALGALMFAVSDLLIFARTGRPLAHEPWVGLTVWGLYFTGQVLIVLGVTRTLAQQRT